MGSYYTLAMRRGPTAKCAEFVVMTSWHSRSRMAIQFSPLTLGQVHRKSSVTSLYLMMYGIRPSSRGEYGFKPIFLFAFCGNLASRMMSLLFLGPCTLYSNTKQLFGPPSTSTNQLIPSCRVLLDKLIVLNIRCLHYQWHK